jgi:AcrR family transcriptional regulator
MSAPARREQILDITAAVVVEHGFGAVSLQGVASAARISRPIVYEHFGDLAGLLNALISRETARALEQARETTLPDLSGGDPAELMLQSLRGFLQAVQSSPNTWRLVLMAPEGAPEQLRAGVREGREQILGHLNESVAPLLLAGDGPFDPEVTARILSALADEYARLLLTDPERFPSRRLLAHARLVAGHIADLGDAPPPPADTGRAGA